MISCIYNLVQRSNTIAEQTFAAWNAFLDQQHPQVDRIDAIITSLEELNQVRPLGAVGLCEIQGTPGAHLGEKVSQEMFGQPGIWVPHSRKSLDEHIGVAAADFDSYEVIDLGHKKKAVMIRMARKAFMIVHLKRLHPMEHITKIYEQIDQANAALEVIDGEKQILVGGDLNGLWFEPPRQMLKRHGLTSVFHKAGKRRQKTHPAPGYEAVLTGNRRKLAKVIGGTNLDDMCVKGLEVVDAGVFFGESDHGGVWATVDDEL